MSTKYETLRVEAHELEQELGRGVRLCKESEYLLRTALSALNSMQMEGGKNAALQQVVRERLEVVMEDLIKFAAKNKMQR